MHFDSNAQNNTKQVNAHTHTHNIVAFHKDYPLVCRWFISLAKHDPFTSAVWKASEDQGYDALKKFVLGNTKPSSIPHTSGTVRMKPKQQHTKQGESQEDIAQVIENNSTLYAEVFV